MACYCGNVCSTNQRFLLKHSYRVIRENNKTKPSSMFSPHKVLEMNNRFMVEWNDCVELLIQVSPIPYTESDYWSSLSMEYSKARKSAKQTHAPAHFNVIFRGEALNSSNGDTCAGQDSTTTKTTEWNENGNCPSQVFVPADSPPTMRIIDTG